MKMICSPETIAFAATESSIWIPRALYEADPHYYFVSSVYDLMPRLAKTVADELVLSFGPNEKALAILEAIEDAAEDAHDPRAEFGYDRNYTQDDYDDFHMN